MEEVSVRDVYLVLKKYVAWIVGFALICGVLATAFTIFGTRQTYTASALVRVDSLRSGTQSNAGQSTAPVAGASPLELQQLALSGAVLDVAGRAYQANRNNSAFPPRNTKLLKVDATPSNGVTTAILRLSLPAADDAAGAVNAWAAATVQVLNARLGGAITKSLGQLNPAVSSAQAALDSAQQNLTRFLTKKDVPLEQAILDVNVKTLSRLGNDLYNAQEDLLVVTAGGAAYSGESAASLNARVRSLQNRQASLRGQVDVAQRQVSIDTAQLTRLQEAVTTQTTRISALNAAASDFQLQAGLNQGLASVFIPADIPTEPDARGALAIIIFATLGGLIIAAIAAFLVEAIREPRAGDRQLHV